MSEQEKLELERYRAFHQGLRRRREEIPGELEALRQTGKGKTVQFRELLSEKLVVETILRQMQYAEYSVPASERHSLGNRRLYFNEDQDRGCPDRPRGVRYVLRRFHHLAITTA